ncbi:bola-like protein [Rozella allomycis CSF55]|uniref:BolA protein domain-containing protein n=1 Tax=Rozella allomycis (strain CSF55) TaxID=988480 RepID=A0A075B0X0_ROZAC|nr:BolA protein domain-containing protein [Rozella allomycis CSF55]RKP20885.1 bola-like protein [Rozella allomycis CSF55]|eukprot:EPZ34476.1 BolA protein domain-containing protein [Rozella allomycis CSF55]
MTGPLYTAMESKLTAAFKPSKLVIVDESNQHAGHAGVADAPSPETHFNITIVSDEFKGKISVQRHRSVYKVLDDEFKKGLHALSLKTLTMEEFQKAN